jgi:hypothetical protein
MFIVASIFFLAVPVAFGVIRAVTTGNDFRYLWLAGAAIVGSMIVTPLWHRVNGPAFWVGCTSTAVAAGAISAAAVAMVMGNAAGLGLAVVAISFGLCTGTGASLAAFARRVT